MEVIAKVNLTGEEARAEFYGIISEFYSRGSRPYKTFSAKRKLMEMFNENEIEEIPKYINQCRVWSRSHPDKIEITMNDYLFLRKLSMYCYKCG